MKIYIRNELEKATALLSETVNTYSDLKYLYHSYLELPTEFKDNYAEVTGKWDINDPAQIDSLIIANTNVQTYRVIFYDQTGAEIYDTGVISVFERISITALPERLIAFSFKATFTASGIVSIGLLHMGMVTDFPRFIVNPSKAFSFRGDSNRTMGGQSYGTFQQPLESFAVSFVRVNNEERNKLKDYMNTVTNVVPHVVDFYSEAHEEFPPMYVTLSNGLETAKRAERNFYWNFNLAWQEAR